MSLLFGAYGGLLTRIVFCVPKRLTVRGSSINLYNRAKVRIFFLLYSSYGNKIKEYIQSEVSKYVKRSTFKGNQT
jgi:hypothetical protein